MEEAKQRAAFDVVFRRRCLTVNSGIYARRYGRAALALTPEGSAVRRRLAAELDWMNSERPWLPHDARRIASLCDDILRDAHRLPEHIDQWRWHVARLRELVGQYETLVAVEDRGRRCGAWLARPALARRKKIVRRRARHRRQ
jgi:hypothetical protein